MSSLNKGSRMYIHCAGTPLLARPAPVPEAAGAGSPRESRKAAPTGQIRSRPQRHPLHPQLVAIHPLAPSGPALQ